MRRRRSEEPVAVEKILDVDASMQGTLAFKDPVNLRINGKFDGKLETKGNLMIGEHADVNADIVGDSITVAGRINGNIKAGKDLRLIAPACVIGDVRTPTLTVTEGAVLEGHCNMVSKGVSSKSLDVLTMDEVAKYLEVDKNVVSEWADSGKLPGKKDGSKWKFERAKIEDWLSNEKIK